MIRERQQGRSLIPVIIVLLTLGFLGVVIYQAMQSQPTLDSWEQPNPVVAQSSNDNNKPAPANVETKKAPVAPATSGDSLDATIRATLAGFFARMPASAIALDTAAKLDLKRARDELQEYLDTLGPEAVETLVSVLDAETDFVNRRFLLYALGRIGTDEAATGLSDHYHKMATLGDKDSEAKHSIRALGQVDTPHSFGLLYDLADQSGDPAHRHEFLEELGGHHMTADAVPLYKRMMVEDGRVAVRSYAARALKRTADPATAPDIEKAIFEERDKYVRQTMIGALGGIGDPNSIPTLEEVTKTDDDHVARLSAVNSLKLIGGPQAERVLERVAENDPNQRVREDAQRALRELRGTPEGG